MNSRLERSKVPTPIVPLKFCHKSMPFHGCLASPNRIALLIAMGLQAVVVHSFQNMSIQKPVIVDRSDAMAII